MYDPGAKSATVVVGKTQGAVLVGLRARKEKGCHPYGRHPSFHQWLQRTLMLRVFGLLSSAFGIVKRSTPFT